MIVIWISRECDYLLRNGFRQLAGKSGACQIIDEERPSFWDLASIRWTLRKTPSFLGIWHPSFLFNNGTPERKQFSFELRPADFSSFFRSGVITVFLKAWMSVPRRWSTPERNTLETPARRSSKENCLFYGMHVFKTKLRCSILKNHRSFLLTTRHKPD